MMLLTNINIINNNTNTQHIMIWFCVNDILILLFNNTINNIHNHNLSTNNKEENTIMQVIYYCY